MQLKEIITEPTSKRTLLRFYDTGVFTVNRFTADKLNLKKGDYLVFFEDESDPQKLYMAVCDTGNHKLNERKRTDGLIFQSLDLAKQLYIKFNVPDTFACFVIGEEKEVSGKKVFELQLNKFRN